MERYGFLFNNLYFFFLCIIFKTQFYKSQFTSLSITAVFNSKITGPKALKSAMSHNVTKLHFLTTLTVTLLWFENLFWRAGGFVISSVTLRFVALRPAILLLKNWVNRTYSRWKIKLIYYIKTINYYNSDYKIEMYAKNYGYKVRSNNYSMCHW